MLINCVACSSLLFFPLPLIYLNSIWHVPFLTKDLGYGCISPWAIHQGMHQCWAGDLDGERCRYRCWGWSWWTAGLQRRQFQRDCLGCHSCMLSGTTDMLSHVVTRCCIHECTCTWNYQHVVDNKNIASECHIQNIVTVLSTNIFQ